MKGHKMKQINTENLEKWLTSTNFSKGAHSVYTPFTLVKKITNKIKFNKNQKILVLFNIEFCIDLVYNKNVDPTQITFVCDHLEKEYFVKKLGIKHIIEDIDLINMTFDVVVGNPPFNIRDEKDKTKTGVSGKTNLFKDFVRKAIPLVKKDGYFAFVTPKMIINELQKNNTINKFELVEINFMSEHDYWKHDTCFFILKNNNKGLRLKLSDKVFSKFIDLEKKTTWEMINLNKSDGELVREKVFGKGTRVIRYLPGSRGTKVTYDKSNDTRIIYGPKVIATALDSFGSITATDEPALVGTSNSFKMKNLSDAKKFALFLKNNKLVIMMKKKMKFKKSVASVRFFKKFDLSQIKTGKEYPKEYNLTKDEINEIESSID